MLGSPAYEAPPATAESTLLAHATLALVFGCGLFWPIIALGVLIGCWWWPSLFCMVICFAVSSLWWSAGILPAIGKSRVFAAWRSHFRLRVWKEQQSPRNSAGGATLYVMVPHGVFPMGLALISGLHEQLFPEHKDKHPVAGVASVFFWIPFFAPLVRWLGGVPAHRTQLQHLLQSGVSCFLFPDGIAGAFAGSSSNNQEVLHIKGRNKYLHLASDASVTIIPVYCFGHGRLFSWSWPGSESWLARTSRHLRMALIAFWPIVPQGEISLVFGRPLKSDETYESAITSLYARYHGHITGYEQRQIKIL
jgi:hypothetical protein